MSGRRDVVALICALVVVAGLLSVVLVIATSDNQVYTATVYGGYLGAVALTVTLLALLVPWWKEERGVTAVPATATQVMAAADQLARRMRSTWRQEATNRRISTPAPVRVQWQWGPHEVAPPPSQVITAPAPGTGPLPWPTPEAERPDSDRPGVLLDAGVVTQIHDEVYCQLPHGRLVLLGGPGAGKTGAMILLLLATLEHRGSIESETQNAEVPVPVWLTLGGWDPATQSLHQWAAATMYRDHPYLRAPRYGPDAATELLCSGRVALFLDGLDEMAPAAQRQALARIAQEGAGLRLVLSSRPDEYHQAIAEGRMPNTAVIAVQPVGPNEASAYLLRDQIGTQHERWAQVGDYLTQHPDSVAAHALNNPLTLSLAREAYQDQDPTSLIDPTKFQTVAKLRTHLLDRLLIVAYPDEHQRAHATRWLGWIAHHMGSERDLAWWHVCKWIPRRQLQLVAGRAAGLAVGLAVGLAAGLAAGLADGIVLGVLSGLAAGLTRRLLGWLEPRRSVKPKLEPKVFILRWPHSRELCGLLKHGLFSRLAPGIALGVAFGIALGVAFGLFSGLTTGIVFVLVFVLVSVPLYVLEKLLGLWLVPLPDTVTPTPVSTYRIDGWASMVHGLTVGLVFGLVFGLFFGLLYRSAEGLAFGLAFGLVFGFALRLTTGAISLVRLTELVLVTTGAGRVKFIRVLEEAHGRQILRQAGAVYQFRHAELQEYLATIHRPTRALERA